MAEKTAIQWTDATLNFWTGCKKVSDGCKYCYMYRDKERYGKDPAEVVEVSIKTINKIIKDLDHQWTERMILAAKTGNPAGPILIFTCSWSDFFIEEADAWRGKAWDIIRSRPHFIWQILTKRPENILSRLPEDWGKGWPNVWLGVSIENNKNTNRILTISQIPARTRFISFEPLLSNIYFTDTEEEILNKHINWAIIGGESGNDNGAYRYRPCEVQWIENLIYDLQEANVATFVKQLGTYIAKKLSLKDRHGGDWGEWPENLRLRQFPFNIPLKR
jgi:protein gp37